MVLKDCRNCNPSKLKLCIAFWIFGICNNYSYVVMLSAAHDILNKLENNNKNTSTDPIDNTTKPPYLNCTTVGSGAILIADIVPTLIFKLVAPLFIQRIRIPYKVVFVSLAAITSFIIVGVSQSISLTLFGVILASLSSGVGEVTFLGLTAFYDKISLSFWSSGTGGAGVFGALSYAGLTTVLSPENTLFVVSAFPVFILIAYIFLQKPNSNAFKLCQSNDYQVLSDDDKGIQGPNSPEIIRYDQQTPSLREKFLLIKAFLFLTIPLALVYLFEYFINQALFELIYFQGNFLNQAGQYRWYQVTYQIGVFISRSSINYIKIRRTWIFSILQYFNVVLFMLQVVYRFIPSIWIMLILILYEGLLGGAAYVNTFHWVLTRSSPEYKEFNMGAASFWDSFGISLSGLISFFIHPILCRKFSK